MPGFMYFLPGITRPTAYQIVEAGLAYAFPKESLTTVDVTRGPDGERGIMVADETRVKASQIGYRPDSQIWRKVPGRSARVGCAAASLPGPSDLARDDMVPGFDVVLGDGNKWKIPVARSFTHRGAALPQAYGVDDDGNWITKGVIPKHEELWDYAVKWWDAVVAQKFDAREEDEESGSESKVQVQFEFDSGPDAALCALKTNYVVDKIEVDMLGLFNQKTIVEALMTLVDWPTVEDLVKKNVPTTDISSLSDGDTAKTIAMLPA